MTRWSPRHGAIALVVVATLAGFTPARSTVSVPSPSNSTLPACLTACPGGDLSFSVTVRDFNNLPIANSSVDLNFCVCPSVRFCPVVPSDGYQIISGCQVISVTGVNGQVTFRLRAGGSCGTPIPVYADGVLLGNLRFASTDQDGDLTVTAADVGAVNAKVGTSDLTGDLDCSASVTAADVAIVTAHGGHNCLVPTGARGTRWGTLKIRYR